MRFFRRGDNPNAVAGLFLLVLLLAIAGPNILPRLTSSVPGFDEGVACQWLRTGENRATHQSMIGRQASLRNEPPISLEVRTNPFVNTADSSLVVSVVVINESIGTVPFVLFDNVPVVGTNNNQPGIGVVFNSGTAIPPLGGGNVNYSTDQIRLLGPRQRCVFRFSFPATELGGVLTGNSSIVAYYRNGTRGIATGNPAIYGDLGLWTGVVTSEPFNIIVAQ